MHYPMFVVKVSDFLNLKGASAERAALVSSGSPASAEQTVCFVELSSHVGVQVFLRVMRLWVKSLVA